MRIVLLVLTLLCSAIIQAGDIVDHLGTPEVYDNVYGYPDSFGQTFISDGQYVVGVDIYIDDPTRPDNPSVNELVGPAELKLYESSDLNNPILLATATAAETGVVLSGLVSLDFDAPVATTAGVTYFFVVVAQDIYGIGLRAHRVDTYSGGSESAWHDTDNNVVPHPLGRDLSFRVRGVESLTAIVDIVINPDSGDCLNINDKGVIPVAILGSADFDVQQIDVSTLSFAGLSVRVRGQRGPLCSIDYSNGDVYPDMVCHFEDDSSQWMAGDSTATLSGSLVSGDEFEGESEICLVE